MNHEGKRFGHLIVIENADPFIRKDGGKRSMCKCICDCGNMIVTRTEYLTSGKKTSCGCDTSQKISDKLTCGHHNDINTRIYRIWSNMLNRCENPNNPAYAKYGGRGIQVYDAWKSFASFKEWAMSTGYNDGLTIDRIDNNLGYNPSNCRWVDATIQNNNRSNNRYITYDGKTMTASQWAKFLGVSYKALMRRIYLGWDIERCFTQPYRV